MCGRPTGNIPSENMTTFEEKYGFGKDKTGLNKLNSIHHHVAQDDIILIYNMYVIKHIMSKDRSKHTSYLC